MSFQTAWAGAGSGEVPGWALSLRLPAWVAGRGSFMACALARCRGDVLLPGRSLQPPLTRGEGRGPRRQSMSSSGTVRARPGWALPECADVGGIFRGRARVPKTALVVDGVAVWTLMGPSRRRLP